MILTEYNLLNKTNNGVLWQKCSTVVFKYVSLHNAYFCHIIYKNTSQYTIYTIKYSVSSKASIPFWT